jgi:hypothetical protein
VYKIQTDYSIIGFFKSLWYIVFTLYVTTLQYVEIEHHLLAALTGAMVLDTVLGIWKAKKLGIKPSSRIGWRGILGLLLVGVAGALFKYAFNIESFIFVSAAVSFMFIYELYSSIAHAYTIYTGVKIKEFDAISMMFKFCLFYLRKMAEKIIKVSDPNKRRHNRKDSFDKYEEEEEDEEFYE